MMNAGAHLTWSYLFSQGSQAMMPLTGKVCFLNLLNQIILTPRCAHRLVS